MRGFIELLGAELSESGEVAILREVETHAAGDLAHGFDLRIAADARNGKADVDRGADAGVEEFGFEIDLAVGDGDYVGRNVSGDVTGLGFDYRQGSERAAAELVVQFGGAFQKTRVQEENVAGESFAARRAAEKQAKFRDRPERVWKDRRRK